MIDLHSHVLWEQDDGARDFDESLAMVKLAAEAGTTDLVATPHANQRYAYDRAAIEAKARKLEEACGGRPRIHIGCDFHIMRENLDALQRRPKRFTVNSTRYLLVELADQVVSGMMLPVFQQILALQLVPIITHPERNPVLQEHPAHLETWVRHGCLMQVTAQSLTGEFGKAAQKYGWQLVDEGQAHFVASDAHDTRSRHPRMTEAFQAVGKRVGAEWADALFVTNPAAVLADEVLGPAPQRQVMSWWSRLRR